MNKPRNEQIQSQPSSLQGWRQILGTPRKGTPGFSELGQTSPPPPAPPNSSHTYESIHSKHFWLEKEKRHNGREWKLFGITWVLSGTRQITSFMDQHPRNWLCTASPSETERSPWLLQSCLLGAEETWWRAQSEQGYLSSLICRH